MGNCAVTQHAVTSWADDGEWELSPTAEESGPATTGRRNDEHMAEVTIRITRRQLQELMEKRAGRGAPKSRRAATELLADVMNVGQVYQQHWRAAAHWRPALQSIPEAVES